MEFSLVCHAARDAEKMGLDVFSLFLSSNPFVFSFLSSIGASFFCRLKPMLPPIVARSK